MIHPLTSRSCHVQVWAVYDERDGFPRVCVLVREVTLGPEFEAWVAWLSPYDPSAAAVESLRVSSLVGVSVVLAP